MLNVWAAVLNVWAAVQHRCSTGAERIKKLNNLEKLNHQASFITDVEPGHGPMATLLLDPPYQNQVSDLLNSLG